MEILWMFKTLWYINTNTTVCFSHRTHKQIYLKLAMITVYIFCCEKYTLLKDALVLKNLKMFHINYVNFKVMSCSSDDFCLFKRVKTWAPTALLPFLPRSQLIRALRKGSSTSQDKKGSGIKSLIQWRKILTKQMTFRIKMISK